MSPAEARRLSRRVCGAAVLLFGLWVALRATLIGWPWARELWLIRGTGYGALGALFGTLAVTPAVRLGAFFSTPPSTAAAGALRRSLGITSASLALVHAGLVLSTYLGDSWQAVLHRPYLRAGLAALAILLALLLTSFPRLIRLFGVRLWKPLHRLAYVAVLFLLQHLLLSPFAPRRLTLGLFVGLALVSLARLLPDRRRRAAA